MALGSLARVVVSTVRALALFLAVFLASNLVAGLATRLLEPEPWIAGLVVQFSFLTFSITAVFLLGGDLRDYGFKLDVASLMRVSLVSIPCSIVLVCATAVVSSEGGGQPILPEDPLLLACLLLLVAPTCEEVFFRGLVQGYLLEEGHPSLSIAVSAILFSAVHVAPFHSAGPALLSAILVSALILGVIAGYFRASTGSLLPAILAHFWFNLTGYIAMKL